VGECVKCKRTTGNGANYSFYYGHLLKVEHGTSSGGILAPTTTHTVKKNYTIEGNAEGYVCNDCISSSRSNDVSQVLRGVGIAGVIVLIVIFLFFTLPGELPVMLVVVCFLAIATQGDEIMSFLFPKLELKNGSQLAIEGSKYKYSAKGYNLFLEPKEYETWKNQSLTIKNSKNTVELCKPKSDTQESENSELKHEKENTATVLLERLKKEGLRKGRFSDTENILKKLAATRDKKVISPLFMVLEKEFNSSLKDKSDYDMVFTCLSQLGVTRQQFIDELINFQIPYVSNKDHIPPKIGGSNYDLHYLAYNENADLEDYLVESGCVLYNNVKEYLDKFGTKEQLANGYIMLLQNSDSDVRNFAVSTLLELKAPTKKMVSGYIDCLDNVDPAVRRFAVTHLGEFANSSIVERLEKMLSDNNRLVRRAVKTTLKEIGDRLNQEQDKNPGDLKK